MLRSQNSSSTKMAATGMACQFQHTCTTKCSMSSNPPSRSLTKCRDISEPVAKKIKIYEPTESDYEYTVEVDHVDAPSADDHIDTPSADDHFDTHSTAKPDFELDQMTDNESDIMVYIQYNEKEIEQNNMIQQHTLLNPLPKKPAGVNKSQETLFDNSELITINGNVCKCITCGNIIRKGSFQPHVLKFTMNKPRIIPTGVYKNKSQISSTQSVNGNNPRTITTDVTLVTPETVATDHGNINDMNEPETITTGITVVEREPITTDGNRNNMNEAEITTDVNVNNVVEPETITTDVTVVKQEPINTNDNINNNVNEPETKTTGVTVMKLEPITTNFNINEPETITTGVTVVKQEPITTDSNMNEPETTSTTDFIVKNVNEPETITTSVAVMKQEPITTDFILTNVNEPETITIDVTVVKQEPITTNDNVTNVNEPETNTTGVTVMKREPINTDLIVKNVNEPETIITDVTVVKQDPINTEDNVNEPETITPDDIVLCLPDPAKATSKEAADKMKAANTEIVNALATDKTTMTTKRGVKRKATNNHYTPEVRAKIAKYATEHGNIAAARKFSQQLQMDVNESTVRAMKKKYLLQVKETKDVPVTQLTPEKRGRPLLLGEIDKDVTDHIRSIREAGGIVNQAIVIATARGLVKHKNPTLLRDAGGPLHIDKTWAVSFLKRLGYVKRKGTKAARKLPDDFNHQKSEFLRIIKETVTKYSIPPQLIFNFDQIGLKIVPVSNWTMTSEGSEQVAIIGLEDKREITALLGSTADGSLLPPQILYQGKTDQCHAKYPFPDDWDVSHTDSHYSTVDSMIRYIEKVLVPYTDKVKEELDLPIRQHAIAVFDVFHAHRCKEVLDALSKARIQHVFVPADCTELQPMDLSVNGELKTALKNEFTNWYADKIAKDVQDDASKKVDLRISILKPLHAKWLCKVFHDLKSKKDHILLGWKKSGISDCIV